MSPQSHSGRWTEARWTEARWLGIGAHFLTRAGRSATVSGLIIRIERVKVYNLIVKDRHLYAIGNSGVLVHNSGGPAPSPKWKPLTNPPQLPPTDISAGWRVRKGPPTGQYPNGYWKLAKPMQNDGWQEINRSTMEPGPQCDTHVSLPPG